MVQEVFYYIHKFLSILKPYYIDLLPIICPALSFLVTNWAYRRNTIKVNNEAERIKYEMRRRYMHLEIKAKNLLEIYPKLNQLIREAGIIVIFFNVLRKRTLESSESINLKNEFETCLNMTFKKDDTYGLKRIARLSNYCKASSLFISTKVDQQVQKIKRNLMNLHQLLQKISNEEYNKDQHIKLIKDR